MLQLAEASPFHVLCRDDTLEGLYFFPNVFLQVCLCVGVVNALICRCIRVGNQFVQCTSALN